MVFEAYVYSLHILGEKFAWERHLVERECELLIDSQCWVVLSRCAGSLTYVSELYFHQVLCDCAHGSLRVMDTYTSLTIRRKGRWFSMLEKNYDINFFIVGFQNIQVLHDQHNHLRYLRFQAPHVLGTKYTFCTVEGLRFLRGLYQYNLKLLEPDIFFRE